MPTKFIRETRSLKIKDFIITDEYILLEKDMDLRAAIQELVGMKNGVVLIREEVGKGKVDRIIGIVTERAVLENLLKVEEPFKQKLGDIMDTHIMEIEEGEDIMKIIRSIRKERPAAVIVRDMKGDFKGYFSPLDYQEADRLLRTMSSEEIGEGGETVDDVVAGIDETAAITAEPVMSIDKAGAPKDKAKPATIKAPPPSKAKGKKAGDWDDDEDDDEDEDDEDPKKRRRKPIPFPGEDDDDEGKKAKAKITVKRGSMDIGRPTSGLGEGACDSEEEEAEEEEAESEGGNDWGSG